MTVGQLFRPHHRSRCQRRAIWHTGGARVDQFALTLQISHLRSLVPSHTSAPTSHPLRGVRAGANSDYWDVSHDCSKRRLKKTRGPCAGRATPPTHTTTQRSLRPAAARRTPVNASTVAPRATGGRALVHGCVPKKGVTTVSAQRHLEREDLAPRVMNVTHRLPALTRWPPGRASRQLAQGIGRGGWSGGQRIRRGGPSAGRAWLLCVCGGGARNSSMCSTFQLAMPISSIVLPSASFMNMFGGAPCVYVTCTFG
jgi:hypothetical protein